MWSRFCVIWLGANEEKAGDQCHCCGCCWPAVQLTLQKKPSHFSVVPISSPKESISTLRNSQEEHRKTIQQSQIHDRLACAHHREKEERAARWAKLKKIIYMISLMQWGLYSICRWAWFCCLLVVRLWHYPPGPPAPPLSKAPELTAVQSQLIGQQAARWT